VGNLSKLASLGGRGGLAPPPKKGAGGGGGQSKSHAGTRLAGSLDGTDNRRISAGSGPACVRSLTLTCRARIDGVRNSTGPVLVIFGGGRRIEIVLCVEGACCHERRPKFL
jgi:hypothetical protein